MKAKDVFQNLYALRDARSGDGDGGYGFVRTIREWAASLNADQRRLFWKVLVHLVRRRNSRRGIAFAGPALEVIAQERPVEAAEALMAFLKVEDLSEAERDALVFTLVRLRSKRSAEMYGHISHALQDGRKAALPIAAAFIHVDQTRCLEMSAVYFSRMLTTTHIVEQHRSYISAFVRNFLYVKESLLQDLVSRTASISLRSSEQLASLIAENLSEPWMLRELGMSRAMALRSHVLRPHPPL